VSLDLSNVSGDLKSLPVVKPNGRKKDRDGLHKRRGIWEYRLLIDGTWRAFSAGTRDYDEARTKYATARANQGRGVLPSDREKLRFTEASDDWLQRRIQDRKAEKTISTDRERLVPVKLAFGGLRLNDFTLDKIYAYRRTRLLAVGPRTVNMEVKVIRQVLDDAKCWARIGQEYKPLKEHKRGPGVALDESQLQHPIEVASSKPEWQTAFLGAWIAANTTMRGCEIKRARLRNIDLAAGLVIVDRQMTKTDGGVREIPLNDEAKEVLAVALDRARLLGASDREHFLFPGFDFKQTKTDTRIKGMGHNPLRPMKSWRTAWRSLRRVAGLPTFRFHDLRHTAITTMAIKGVPMPTIMALAGHLSPVQTLYYTHVANRAKKSAVSTLTVFAGQNTPPTVGERVATANKRARLRLVKR
jgi:integrase